MFLHVLSIMYSSSASYAQNPALEIVDQQKSLNVYLHIRVQKECSAEEPFCAASCVTKNIRPDANSVILRAHLCTAVGFMLKTLYSKLFMRRGQSSTHV